MGARAVRSLPEELLHELRISRRYLLEGFLQPSDAKVPTAFVLLSQALPSGPDEEEERVAIERLSVSMDGKGFEGGYQARRLTPRDDGDEEDGEAPESGSTAALIQVVHSRVQEGLNYLEKLVKIVTTLPPNGHMIATLASCSKAARELHNGQSLFLYPIDELTGEPARGPGAPVMVGPELVGPLLPLLAASLRSAALSGGIPAIAGCMAVSQRSFRQRGLRKLRVASRRSSTPLFRSIALVGVARRQDQGQARSMSTRKALR